MPDDEPESLADESLARLTLYSDTKTAEELAAALGVNPDDAWNKGDTRKQGKAHTTTAIGLRSQLPADRPPNDHLEDLLTRIEPLHDRIADQIGQGITVRLKLVLFADTDNPTLTLTPEVLRRLAGFGVEFELDIYTV